MALRRDYHLHSLNSTSFLNIMKAKLTILTYFPLPSYLVSVSSLGNIWKLLFFVCVLKKIIQSVFSFISMDSVGLSFC